MVWVFSKKEKERRKYFMQKTKELNEYRMYTTPAELHKAVNTLHGIVAGITTDRQISEDEINELSHWCLCHANLIDRHPFSELIPLLQSVYEDGIITEDESKDIIWLCNNFISDADYYDLVTSSLQFLNGMIHGILADNQITDDEIHMLKKWTTANDFLSGSYPFDDLHYGVVLDNKNAHNSPVVTVIPLTSARENRTLHSNSVNLGNDIYRLLKLKYDTIDKALKEEQQEIEETLSLFDSMLALSRKSVEELEQCDKESDEFDQKLLIAKGHLETAKKLQAIWEEKSQHNKEQQDYLEK